MEKKLVPTYHLENLYSMYLVKM